uniref:Uncharacterized protein n=1 Tax=Hucho hucho TaxID=62062 RepID=A0A4W5NHG0_9TELE
MVCASPLQRRDGQRGSDNMSAKSSDSDVSDVSAVSRTSSASRFSSTSYMSVQSERPRGKQKIRNQSREGDEHLGEVLEEEEVGREEVEGEEGGTHIGQGKQREGEEEEDKEEGGQRRTTVVTQKSQEEMDEEEMLRRRFSETDLRQLGTSSGSMNMTKSTSIGGDMCNLEKTDGSQSDTGVGMVGEDGDKKRRSSIGAKMAAVVGLSRKSRSTSQLSQTVREGLVKQ